MKRILIACEFSGVVSRAFQEAGHEVMSCDLLPSEDSSLPHYEGDVRDILETGYDLLCAFPPCTYLCSSGARWHSTRRKEQAEAIAFVQTLLDAPIACIALENPIGVISTRIRKPDQIIQPWQYGHGEVKSTCLWLKNLPLLTPSNIVDGREPKVHRMSPGPTRWKERSRTYAGIAQAMADQWGGAI